MDSKAYQKAKDYLHEAQPATEATIEAPPPGTDVWQWMQQKARDNLPEIMQRMEKMLELAMRPKTWSAEEQDVFAEIAASPDEPTADRLGAMHAISSCHLMRHAALVAALLEDPQMDSNVRHGAAWALGQLGLREWLPLLYDVAHSVAVSPEAYRARLYDACIRAMFWIAARNKFIDGDGYRMRPYNNISLMCKRWWDEAQPTKQMILAWSRGEITG